MKLDQPHFEKTAVEYVRQAVLRTLQIGDSFGTKMEAGGSSHVGTADIANTDLAEAAFSQFPIKMIIEESLPPFSYWSSDEPILFVDPVDGSSEVGCGGAQFSAAVSLYGPDGIPIFSAAATPGLRPIFRTSNGRFDGFAGQMGAVIFGGPSGTWLSPLWPSQTDSAIRVALSTPRLPSSGPYTNVALDPNAASICGLRKGSKLIKAGLSRMPFSNIFSQMQVVLGQADAATLGPAQRLQNTPSSGQGVSGPKAWDLLIPAALGVGLSYSNRVASVASLNKAHCYDSFVLRERWYLSHPDVLSNYVDGINELISQDNQ
ncbi:hypothetical protein [Mesorhizobium sp. GbtcB19]|uniref:hypothetical protein n=1 Tax=Mesorhizobium sp. GbtcB19 TaxID=2824764 RepID=UPI001C309712|nr:hypothetical protein [Mesorhizobium sp. GbtcB19]